MKFYLLNPPFLKNFVRCGRWQGVAARGGTMYYPIWLAYATGLLEKEGHSVRLIDAITRNWDRKQVLEDVKNFQPDVIVVDTNFSSLKNDTSITSDIKHETNALSIIVGPPAAQYAEQILNDGVDIVARKEYDFTLKELAELLQKGHSWENIDGISYKKNGTIFHNQDRRFSTSEELNEIPFVSKVYKEHLNINDYFLNHAFYPMVQIFSSRGCPNQCTFCSWPENLMGRKYRARSVENLVDEFEFIKNELPEIKEIFLEDDSFTINKNRVLSFCEELQKRKMKISWGCQTRGTLDLETMVAMKNAGCRLLDVGYESGNDEILRNIKKGITVDQLREFSKNAKKAKLKILADFVIGFPGETKETAEKTVKFIHEVKPDLLQIAIATPMPGTEFYIWVKENKNILSENLENSIDDKGFQKCIISYPEMTSEEIQKFVDKSLKEYYLNISYIPIAIKNIFNKGGISEIILIMKSASMLLNYFKKEKNINQREAK